MFQVLDSDDKVWQEIPSAPTQSARDVTAAYVDTYRATHHAQPPEVARVARDAKALLAGGYSFEAVKAAAQRAAESAHANLRSALTQLQGEHTRIDPFAKPSGLGNLIDLAHQLDNLEQQQPPQAAVTDGRA